MLFNVLRRKTHILASYVPDNVTQPFFQYYLFSIYQFFCDVACVSEERITPLVPTLH